MYFESKNVILNEKNHSAHLVRMLLLTTRLKSSTVHQLLF